MSTGHFTGVQIHGIYLRYDQNQIQNHDFNNKIPGKSFCIIGQNYGLKQVIFNVLICL